MNEIQKDFDKIKINTYECKAGKRYFDSARNIFVFITPEEMVRQKMIVFLNQHLGVDFSRMFIEDHLSHYGVKEQNGRIDISILDENDIPLAIVECKEPKISISGLQVYEQGVGYASAIGARYVILVNGIEIQYYKFIDEQYVPIDEILTYEQMLEGEGSATLYEPFIRYSMDEYEDIPFLKSQNWFSDKIGEDMEDYKIPAVINLDDALWDCSHTLSGMISENLEVIEDLGINPLNYNDASGGGFGSGYYRLFLINNKKLNKQFISGLSIIATGKTVNDTKYGTRNGLTVLVVCRNDGDYDETSVQINMNKFLEVTDGVASLTHNAAITRKGASKSAAMSYIESQAPFLIKNGKVILGAVNITVPLYVDNPDVKKLIGNVIEYSIHRDDYKHSL